jgi:predicted nucleotidyltransferase
MADVDFGLSVQSWAQFEQLRAAFLASGHFEKDSKCHEAGAANNKLLKNR